MEPRWYFVDATGFAEPFHSGAYAREVAEQSNDVGLASRKPYRAVLLGDVAAERETIQRLREVMQRMVAGLDHLDKLTREWEPDHSSGADRAGWVRASHALNEARALLKT